MDFGSFLKKREQENLRQNLSAQNSPNRLPPGNDFNQVQASSTYGGDYQAYGDSFYGQPGVGTGVPIAYEESTAGSSYHQESFDSYVSHGRGGYIEHDVSHYAGPFRGPGIESSGFGHTEFEYHTAMRGKGRGQFTRGGNTYSPNSGNEYNARGRDSDYYEQSTHDFRCSYGNNEDFAQGKADDNFAEDFVNADQMYGFEGEYDPYGITTEKKAVDDPGDNSKGTTVTTGKREQNKPTQDSNEIQDPDKEKEAAKDNSDEDGEDDAKAEAINKLPASHNRGLMSTLIGMLGPEALNRKPDPLPPVKPAPLKPKDDWEISQQKKLDKSALKDKTEDAAVEEGEKHFDVMKVPSEKRTINPNDCIQDSDKEKKAAEDNSDEDGEGDAKAEAIKKLPASHNRGLMSTLIGMLGPEALNRKPDPLPPVKPAPLKRKDEWEGYQQRKQDEGAAEDEGEGEKHFDVMNLPPEQRNLNPNDFVSGGSTDLFCKICQIQTTSARNLQEHLAGRNHRTKMANIASGKIAMVKGIKKRIMLEHSQLGKHSLVLEVLKNVKREAMLGLSYITEFQSVGQVMCVCNLCGVKFDSNAAVSHISGVKHRYQYMKEKRPAEYVHLKRFGGKRSHLVNFLEDLSRDVEKEEGRGEPVLKVFEEPEKGKSQDSQKDSAAEEKDSSQETKDDYIDEQKKERSFNKEDAGNDQESKGTDNNEKEDKEQDEEASFIMWVNSECKRSRHAREQRKSLSPSGDRFGDEGHSFDHGPRRPIRNPERDHYHHGPPNNRRGIKRPPFEGPYPPMYPFNDIGHPPRHPFGHRGQSPDHSFDGPGRRLYPPRDPYFDGPRREQRDFLPPHRPNVYPPREGPPATPYFDPDPIRRLDALKKARQEFDPLKRVAPRSEPYLDPDPLKRVLKRDAIYKPVVIDYSHGNTKNERSPPSTSKQTRSWEKDIESILGEAKDKNLNSLATLSNTYLSPEKSPTFQPAQAVRQKEETKVEKILPFSKSYLDIPENRQKLKGLRKLARSPPISGFEKESFIDLTKEHKRSRSRSKSSSSLSLSPSPNKVMEADSKQTHTSGRDSLNRFQQPIQAGPQRYNHRSRSRSPFKRTQGYKSRKPLQRSPGYRGSRSPPRKSPGFRGRRSPLKRPPGYMDRSPPRKSPGFRGSRSPFKRSPSYRGSRSPVRRSPGYRGWSPTPRSQGYRGSRSPIRRGSRSPIRRSAGYGGSRSPVRGSQTYRGWSPVRKPPGYRGSRSPFRKSPGYRGGRSPVRRSSGYRGSRSPIKSNPAHRRSRSPVKTLPNYSGVYSQSPDRVKKGVSHHSRDNRGQDKIPLPAGPSTSEDLPNKKSVGDKKIKEKRSTERVHKEQKKTAESINEPEEDNEDVQAERIADMLLKMSSSLTFAGDTLQALLSNPDMAKTILEAQTELVKQPSSSERSLPTSQSAKTQRAKHMDYSDSRNPHSTFRYPKSQSPSHRNTAVSRKQPTRERVAFSLSGTGRNSLQQSSAFAMSSDEEEEPK